MGLRDWTKTIRRANGTVETIPLSMKERRFLIYYLQSFNQIDAAKKAGLQTAKELEKWGEAGYSLVARDMLNKKWIQDIILEETEKASLGKESILEMLKNQAQGSISMFFDDQDVYLEVPSLNPDGSPVLDQNSHPVLALRRAVDQEGHPLTVPRFNQKKFKEYGHLVKKIDVDGSKIKIELYDAQRALELLGKAQAVFTEKLDVQEHGDIVVKVVKGVSLEDI